MNFLKKVFAALFSPYLNSVERLFIIARGYLNDRKSALNKQNSPYIAFIGELVTLLEKTAFWAFIIYLFVLFFPMQIQESLRLQVWLMGLTITLLAFSFLGRVASLFRFFNWTAVQFLYPILVSILLTLSFIPSAISESLAILRNIFPPEVSIQGLLAAQSFLEYRIIAAQWLMWGGWLLTASCLIYGFICLFRASKIQTGSKNPPLKFVISTLKGIGYIGAAAILLSKSSSMFLYYKSQMYAPTPSFDLVETLVTMEYTPNAPLNIQSNSLIYPTRIYCNLPVPLDSYIYPLDNRMLSVATLGIDKASFQFQEMKCAPFQSEQEYQKALENVFIIANFGKKSSNS